MNKILIFKIGALGDILMTTPLIKQLGGNDRYKIDYMCGDNVKQIIQNNQYIDNIISYDFSFFKNIKITNVLRFAKLLLFLFLLRKEYSHVVILDKHILFNFMFWITGFKNRFGFNRLGSEGKFLTKSIYYDKSKREVEYYLDYLNFFNIEPDYKQQKYIYNNKSIERENDIDNKISSFKNNKVIGIATGGGNLLMPKNDCRWRSINNWEYLSKSLLKKGYVVILLGSKNDRNIDINDDNFHNLLGKYTISETIYLVSKLDLVVSQEAGFIHFVGCTDTNLLTIAGPTNPERFHPYNNIGNPQGLGRIWKEKIECYDVYGSYDKCNGDEINKVSVGDVMKKIYSLSNKN